MIRLALAMILFASTARAEAPRVMTDIAPVQSLVAMVMVGVGAPDVLIPPGASPHDFALRPSDAERLSQADLVIWTGPALSQWLTEPLDTLAGDATQIALLSSSGWTALPLRTDPAFADGDESGPIDPHAWLDPSVASAWVQTIAASLSQADPAHASLYAANAQQAKADLGTLSDTITTLLAPVTGRTYVVPHDGYQYFEHRFDMPAAGAISLSDATTPGPARIQDLQVRVAQGHIDCVLTDPETNPAWGDLLRQGTMAKTALVDPDGMTLPRGPDLYPALLTNLATALAACLSP